MAVISFSSLDSFWNSEAFKETFFCGCKEHVLAAPFVCYVAFLDDPNDPRVVECVRCGATWLASDVPIRSVFDFDSSYLP